MTKGSLLRHVDFVIWLCVVANILLTASVFFPSQASAEPIVDRPEVLGFSKRPNYRLSTDKEDVRQLTDGVLVRFPMWTKQGSVGWHGRTPVSITMRLSPSATNANGVSAVVRLHTTKGSYAGVHPPRRVDVYSSQDGQPYVFVGGAQIPEPQLSDRDNHWLDVPVTLVGPDVVIVVHAQGSYIFLDEIELHPSGEKGKGGARAAETLKGEKEAVVDSTNRLKAYLEMGDRREAEVRVKKDWVEAFGDRQVVAWVEDCWNNPQRFPSVEHIKRAPQNIRILGTHQEQETACVGLIFTGTGTSEVSVDIDGAVDRDRSFSLSSLSPVMAANGEHVYDPIIPVTRKSIELSDRRAHYLWLTADLNTFPPGKHRVSLRLASPEPSFQRAIPIAIDVVKLNTTRFRPDAINWSYSDNQVIWTDPQRVVDDLVAHGITVFPVHPRHIPPLKLDGSWDAKAAVKLNSELELFASRGLVMLIPRWPDWLSPNSEVPIQTQEKVFKEWLRRLSGVIRASGLEYDQWALYTNDEPYHGPRMEILKKIAQWTKQLDPQIQIYANPTTTRRNDRKTVQGLRKIAELIDIWQPRLALASEGGRAFFASLDKPWWIYHNPPILGKLGSPLADYRLPAWHAWYLGASGVGFWAYGDTVGSSAWDDFDGIRPDWAVVYESDNGPISSRRWEAFRDGNEDFGLLKAISKIHNLPEKCSHQDLRNRVSTFISTETPSINDINKTRHFLLQSCIP